METIQEEDASRLKALIMRHVRETGSDKGRMILTAWSQEIKKFIKVVPIEYQRVLQAKKLSSNQKNVEFNHGKSQRI